MTRQPSWLTHSPRRLCRRLTYRARSRLLRRSWRRLMARLSTSFPKHVGTPAGESTGLPADTERPPSRTGRPGHLRLQSCSWTTSRPGYLALRIARSSTNPMPLVASLDGARQTVRLLSADDPTVFQRPAEIVQGGEECLVAVKELRAWLCALHQRVTGDT